METLLPPTSICSFAYTHEIDAEQSLNMATPPPDSNAPKPSSYVMPTRISKIPSLRSSRRTESERRPVSYTSTSTGSPKANVISPPLRNNKSQVTGSKIPQLPSTMSQTPVPRATRPMPAFEAPKSTHPRAMSTKDAATLKSPPNLVRIANISIFAILIMHRSTQRRISTLASTSRYLVRLSRKSSTPTARQRLNVLLSTLRLASLQRKSGPSSVRRKSLRLRLY
jgi:hypothetical protein